MRGLTVGKALLGGELHGFLDSAVQVFVRLWVRSWFA